MGRHVVASVEELSNGEMREITVEETDLLLVRLDDAFYAIDAHCSHYGGALAEGLLEAKSGHVICPLHHAVFDVTSGEDVEPPAPDCLQSYPVETHGEDVVLEYDNAEAPYVYGDAEAEASERIVILGAGAAAASAADTLRRYDFGGSIVLVTPEDEPPYDRPNLSKDYLAGVAQPEWIPLRSEKFYDEHDIEIATGREAREIDLERHRVQLNGDEMLSYDKLLVATGASPIELDVPGRSFENVQTLRSLTDAHALIEQLEESSHATIVGSSFIGMESAFSLRKRGLDVTVVSLDEHPFEALLGPRIGESIQHLHAQHGVEFALDHGVERIEGEKRATSVQLDDGASIETDLVVVGIGVRPTTEFAEDLERGDDGGLVVDDHLRADEHVYAAGDVARFPDPHTPRSIRVEHWRLAQQHGRIAARNMLDQNVTYDEVPFFWTRHFETAYKYVGHAHPWEDIVIRGDVDDHDFIAYYTSNNTILAAFGTRRDQLTRVHALMRHESMPSAEELRSGDEV